MHGGRRPPRGLSPDLCPDNPPSARRTGGRRGGLPECERIDAGFDSSIVDRDQRSTVDVHLQCETHAMTHLLAARHRYLDLRAALACDCALDLDVHDELTNLIRRMDHIVAEVSGDQPHRQCAH